MQSLKKALQPNTPETGSDEYAVGAGEPCLTPGATAGAHARPADLPRLIKTQSHQRWNRGVLLGGVQPDAAATDGHGTEAGDGAFSSWTQETDERHVWSPDHAPDFDADLGAKRGNCDAHAARPAISGTRPGRQNAALRRGLVSRAARLAGQAGALVIVACLLSALAGRPVVTTGMIASAADRALISGGLEIRQVSLSGDLSDQTDALYQALAITGPVSFAGYDIAAARARVAALSWVSDVRFSAVLPASLHVEVRGKQPVAVVLEQRSGGGGQQPAEAAGATGAGPRLVAAAGAHLHGPVSPARIAALPRIAGDGAAQAVTTLLSAMAKWPALRRDVAVFHRVGRRRWTLELHDGLTIHLPADDARAGDLARAFEQAHRLRHLAGTTQRLLAHAGPPEAGGLSQGAQVTDVTGKSAFPNGAIVPATHVAQGEERALSVLDLRLPAKPVLRYAPQPGGIGLGRVGSP